jgi:hypothetical protein
MWMYPGPSCPTCPFSKELGDTEINTTNHIVLAHGVILNIGTNPAPLREGADNPWVSSLGLTFGYLFQFWFLNVFLSLHRVLAVFAVPRMGSPYLRMRRGGRPIMPIANGCRYIGN